VRGVRVSLVEINLEGADAVRLRRAPDVDALDRLCAVLAALDGLPRGGARVGRHHELVVRVGERQPDRELRLLPVARAQRDGLRLAVGRVAEEGDGVEWRKADERPLGLVRLLAGVGPPLDACEPRAGLRVPDLADETGAGHDEAAVGRHLVPRGRVARGLPRDLPAAEHVARAEGAAPRGDADQPARRVEAEVRDLAVGARQPAQQRAGLHVPEAYEVSLIPVVAVVHGRERRAVGRDGERVEVVVPRLPRVGRGAPLAQHEEARAADLLAGRLLRDGDEAVLRARDEAPAGREGRARRAQFVRLDHFGRAPERDAREQSAGARVPRQLVLRARDDYLAAVRGEGDGRVPAVVGREEGVVPVRGYPEPLARPQVPEPKVGPDAGGEQAAVRREGPPQPAVYVLSAGVARVVAETPDLAPRGHVPDDHVAAVVPRRHEPPVGREEHKAVRDGAHPLLDDKPHRQLRRRGLGRCRLGRCRFGRCRFGRCGLRLSRLGRRAPRRAALLSGRRRELGCQECEQEESEKGQGPCHQ
jgi:hypothetical protein